MGYSWVRVNLSVIWAVHWQQRHSFFPVAKISFIETIRSEWKPPSTRPGLVIASPRHYHWLICLTPLYILVWHFVSTLPKFLIFYISSYFSWRTEMGLVFLCTPLAHFSLSHPNANSLPVFSISFHMLMVFLRLKMEASGRVCYCRPLIPGFGRQ